MKKKSLILVLVCMLITALCACGGGSGDGGSADGEKVVWKYAHTGRNGDELDQYANACNSGTLRRGSAGE